MTLITRRRSLAMLGGTLAATTVGAQLAHASHRTAKSLVAFGDSYTASYRNGIPSWADQLHASGVVKMQANFGYSGATSEGLDSPKTLDGQIDRWIANYRSKGVPDRTVIYFGYNDISPDKPLTAAMNQYRRGVDRLMAAGAVSGTRRMLLCLLHDWTHNPARKTDARARVLEWNRFVTKIADDRNKVITVDLFSRLEDVYRNKGAYGLTNVTDVNAALSATTYLYVDGSHFGRKGQSIIANEVKARLP